WGRVGLVARDMGRASIPSSVCSCRNVNCVGRNVKPAGFSGSIARVLGVRAREDTIRVRKPRGGPANASTSDVPGGRNATAVFRDSDHEKASPVRERTYFFLSASARRSSSLRDTSSWWVAIHQELLNESFTPAVRSP